MARPAGFKPATY